MHGNAAASCTPRRALMSSAIASTKHAAPQHCVRLLQLLAAANLAALATTFAARLDAGQTLPFPLTAKLVETAVEGALKTPGDTDDS